MVNSRPRCRAEVTSKRSLENYLHPQAVFEASSFSVTIAGEENVPELVARKANEGPEPQVPWDDLPARARKRLCYKKFDR